MIYLFFILLVVTPLIIWGRYIKREEVRMTINTNHEYHKKLERVESLIKDVMNNNKLDSTHYRYIRERLNKAEGIYHDYERDNPNVDKDSLKIFNLEKVREAINYLDEAIKEYDPIAHRDKVIDDLLEDY